MRDVHVARTGVANLASVLAALARAGAAPVLTDDPEQVRAADRVLLPGVGAFGAGAARLRDTGLGEALAERVRAGRPTMGICLGMQLFFDASAEAPGVPGLGVIAGEVERFSGEGLRVPQLGWNEIVPGDGCRLLRRGFVYFANSYRARAAPGWAVATAHHGGPFLAGCERGDVLLCQFHPELSGAFGAALLERWIAC
jgi:imidazole glycerol phosphate synthase glutamine amidotransferase subunit